MQDRLTVKGEYINKQCVIEITIILQSELEMPRGSAMGLILFAELNKPCKFLEVGLMASMLKSMIGASDRRDSGENCDVEAVETRESSRSTQIQLYH
jgi:hypothetical protein